jgi:uncharacterized protein YdeI (BOF family)
MKAFITAIAMIAFAGAVGAASKTWTGQISDSMCGAKHMSDEHGKKMTDRECTLACLKDGSKYVFVSDGKVYRIANQDLKDLEVHPGHTVKLTGELDGDAITVLKVEMPTKTKSGH